jgi:hypothetical protein
MSFSFPKKISIKWHIDDVLSIRPHLTNLQAYEVLEHILIHHDANVGVNWGVIETVSDTIFPELQFRE